MTGRAGINLIMYPNLLITGAGVFNVLRTRRRDKTIVHMYGVSFDDAPPEVNALKARFLEDFAAFGNRDDNEVFERIQSSLANIPEMECSTSARGSGRRGRPSAPTARSPATSRTRPASAAPTATGRR